MTSKKRICIVVGTRPEVIKMAPVYRGLSESSSLQPTLLATGQHRELLDQTLSACSLWPDHDLQLMVPGQSLADLTASVVSGSYEYFSATSPDAVLVQGDTTTVLSTALAAFYKGIPVGHVEAGLRTYDSQNPWPEEMNRRLTGPLARWHFAPTEKARQNLLDEQVPSQDCHVTGNTIVDSLLWMRDRLEDLQHHAADVASAAGIPTEFSQQYLQSPKSRWILVTGHRRETQGQPFVDICNAIAKVADAHKDVGVLFALHLNPNVRQAAMQLLGGHPRIALIDPVGYLDFVWLMNRCTMLISDSGGIQEEAPSLGKPVLVTRTVTERPEAVEAGTCRLVGSNPETILKEVGLLLNDSAEYARRACLENPYGDGHAGRRICEILEAAFSESPDDNLASSSRSAGVA